MIRPAPNSTGANARVTSASRHSMDSRMTLIPAVSTALGTRVVMIVDAIVCTRVVSDTMTSCSSPVELAS